jgi:putative Mg2+ transporter-C (MgtC) family protein
MASLSAAIFHDTLALEPCLLVIIRLSVAAVLGTIPGMERQREGKAAGMRTYMLVSLGAALFTLIPILTGVEGHDLTRVIQGVAAGVGFLGAGAILKAGDEHRIEGLTSAAAIWVTAAAGMSVGAGYFWPALVATVFGWVILDQMQRIEAWLGHKRSKSPPEDPSQ